jgi:hypothetical protein
MSRTRDPTPQAHDVCAGALLLCARRHPLLAAGLLQEGLHVLAFETDAELHGALSWLQRPHAAAERAGMVERAHAHVLQHHSVEARAQWLSHVVATVARGLHYDQRALTFGANN